MTGWEVVGLVLGSNLAVEIVKVLAARAKIQAETAKVGAETDKARADTDKTEADAAAVLVGSTVNLVKLKDDLFNQLKAELTGELETERGKRRELGARVETLEGEKKIWFSRLRLSKARTSNSNSKPVYATTSMRDWREKTSS